MIEAKVKSELAMVRYLIESILSGKQIQEKCFKVATHQDVWEDVDYNSIDWKELVLTPSQYRVKPEPEYRAFKSIYECIEGCKKHQPFGYIQNVLGNAFSIVSFYDNKLILGTGLTEKLESAFMNYVFLDGSKFGKIKE